jgi:hypothetical protein
MYKHDGLQEGSDLKFCMVTHPILLCEGHQPDLSMALCYYNLHLSASAQRPNLYNDKYVHGRFLPTYLINQQTI